MAISKIIKLGLISAIGYGIYNSIKKVSAIKQLKVIPTATLKLQYARSAETRFEKIYFSTIIPVLNPSTVDVLINNITFDVFYENIKIISVSDNNMKLIPAKTEVKIELPFTIEYTEFIDSILNLVNKVVNGEMITTQLLGQINTPSGTIKFNIISRT